MNNRLIILVHGFNKNGRDMRFLADQLTLLGHAVHVVNLPTTFGSLNDAVMSLAQQVNQIGADKKSISFVAHSMGGLIVRKFLAHPNNQRLSNIVFIAPPHRGSKLADIADKIPGFSAIFKPIPAMLSTSGYEPLPTARSYRLGIIAGSNNPSFLGKRFLSRESDGRVELMSTYSSDVDDFMTVPFCHKKIHHKMATVTHIDQFLREGVFRQG